MQVSEHQYRDDEGDLYSGYAAVLAVQDGRETINELYMTKTGAPFI